MKLRKIVLEANDNAQIQKNVRIYGHKKFGPYSLVLEKIKPQPPYPVRIECLGRILGRVPQRFADKLSRRIYDGRIYEARPQRLLKREGEDHYDLMVKIYPISRRRKKFLRRNSWRRFKNSPKRR